MDSIGWSGRFLPTPAAEGTIPVVMERTLLLIKPDGVQRGLVGRILSRFEDKGLKLVGLKVMRITPELARA